jgi:uncharacterized protein (DUF433 family)
MTTTSTAKPTTTFKDQVLERLERIEAALQRLAAALEDLGNQPAHPAGYKHLELRAHPWRRQPYVPGIRMTVHQLVGQVRLNRWTPEQAAFQYDLPVEAVREALEFAESHPELLEYEGQYEWCQQEKWEKTHTGGRQTQ